MLIPTINYIRLLTENITQPIKIRAITGKATPMAKKFMKAYLYTKQ